MTSLPNSESSTPVLLKSDCRGRVRTPPEQREALLAAFDATTMSGAEFARHHGLSYATFMSWLAARKRKPASSERAQRSGPLFHEVVLDVREAPGVEAGGIVVELPGGSLMRVQHAGQIKLAAAMLRALGEQPC
jgi:hypothetical protein